MTHLAIEPLISAKEAIQATGLSSAGFWQAVKEARLPRPFYPLARAPRWKISEITAALEKTRAMPHEQKIARQRGREKSVD